MTETKLKALIYCRVSGARQKIEGHGLESQEHRCRQYASENGWIVDKVFPDSFTGGGDFLNRPAMKALLAYVDSHPHQQYVVIFDDLKRFARDTVFHWNLRSAFKARDIIPKCLNYNFDESPEGVFVETIFAAQNQLEREQNKRQVVQKQKARLESGYWPFYPPPGYVQTKVLGHGKLLTPTPKAKIVLEAFEGFASNRFVDQVDVQKFLQKNHFRNRRPVYLTLVKRLLERAVYAGYIEYKPWEVGRRLGHHKAIISLDLFERVQEKLTGKARSFSRADTRDDFPLRGPVVCNGCKHSLTASWSKGRNKKHPYYRCTQQGCPFQNKSIAKTIIESRFDDLLKSVKPKEQVVNYAKALFSQEWQKRMIDIEAEKGKKVSELKNIISEKEVFLDRILRTESPAVIEAYEKKVEELSQKELLLNEQIQNPAIKGLSFGTALETVLDYITNPHKKWVNGDLNDKRLTLKLVFIDKIAYDYQSGFGTANYSLPIKAFELLATSKSQGVDLGRIELPIIFS